VRAEDDEEGDFFYDEEEVLAGAGGQARAAMLDHYDSLLDMPRADQLDEVLSSPHLRLHICQKFLPPKKSGDQLQYLLCSWLRRTRSALKTPRKRRRRKRRAMRTTACRTPRAQSNEQPPGGAPTS
jgi:hypothetical protein